MARFTRKTCPSLNTGLLSEILSPLSLIAGPGIDYKHSDAFNIFLSPASTKLIYVNNKDLANLGIHGTKLKDEDDPTKGYRQSDFQIGASLIAQYLTHLFTDKISLTSKLNLFSNYLHNPQNVDVIWSNDLNFQIIQNLGISIGHAPVLR